jgi:hypothetical protein
MTNLNDVLYLYYGTDQTTALNIKFDKKIKPKYGNVILTKNLFYAKFYADSKSDGLILRTELNDGFISLNNDDEYTIKKPISINNFEILTFGHYWMPLENWSPIY